MKENLGARHDKSLRGQPHQYPPCNVKYKTTLSVCVTVNWGIFSNDVVFRSNINDILTCKLDSLSGSTLFYLINYKTIVFMEKQISQTFLSFGDGTSTTQISYMAFDFWEIELNQCHDQVGMEEKEMDFWDGLRAVARKSASIIYFV